MIKLRFLALRGLAENQHSWYPVTMKPQTYSGSQNLALLACAQVKIDYNARISIRLNRSVMGQVIKKY